MNKLESLTEVLKVKFFWNGIKVNGQLFRGYWSKGLVNQPETITFYARTYDAMPNIGLNVHNDTDIMTDYFEKDRMRFTADKPYYLQAVNACMAHKEHSDKRHQAYLIRNGVTV